MAPTLYKVRGLVLACPSLQMPPTALPLRVHAHTAGAQLFWAGAGAEGGTGGGSSGLTGNLLLSVGGRGGWMG